MAMNKYLVLQGIVQAAEVVAGVPGKFLDLMDVSQMDLGFTAEEGTHTEHRSGQRLEDFTWETKNSGTVTLGVDSHHAENIAMMFRGEVSTLSGSFTAEEIAATLPAVGDILRLPYGNLSAVVITDSSAGPKTLTAGTNYRLDADYGDLEVLNVTTGAPFVAPLKAAGSYGAQTNITLMTSAQKEYWLRYKGVNPDGARVLVELYRWKPKPGEMMKLITGEVTVSSLQGKVMADNTKANDAELGQFGRVIYL